MPPHPIHILIQNSWSYFQIHSPPDISIHIRHASRTVQRQTAMLQFIVFTSFCWTSHPVLNLCWQILFLLWSEKLESTTGTYQMCWINRHLQETLETSSVWTSLCIANNCTRVTVFSSLDSCVLLNIFCSFLWSALIQILFLIKALYKSHWLIDWLIDWLISNHI